MSARRSIQILGTDQELDLSRVVEVRVAKKFLMLENLPDGTFRLTYSKSLIDDIQKVSGFIIVRED